MFMFVEHKITVPFHLVVGCRYISKSCPMVWVSFNCCIFFIFHCILCFIYYSINRMEDSTFLTRSTLSNEQWAWVEMLLVFGNCWRCCWEKCTTAFVIPLFVYILLNWCFLPFYTSLSLSFHYYISDSTAL